MKHYAILLTMIFASLFAFAGEPEADAPKAADTGPRDYVFVMLILDDPEALSKEELNTAMQGHFSNMKILAEKEKLLVAGPFAEPRISEKHRGIFVFDSKTLMEGNLLTSTDPSVRAGVFDPETYIYRSASNLLALPAIQRARDKAQEAIPEEERVFDGRAYVWAMGPTDAELADDEHVLIDGELINYEGDESRRFILLDAQTVEQAEAMFDDAESDAWSFFGWYGSNGYAELSQAAASTASP
jgi:uncharacterized protein YciI